jgi:hypothetical protein
MPIDPASLTASAAKALSCNLSKLPQTPYTIGLFFIKTNVLP